jgi:hypothetical protein
VLQGQQDPALLCTMNGPPSSTEIFDGLVDCLCVSGCAAECGDNACMGMDGDMACQTCAFNACGGEVQACLQDGGPPPACVGCSDVVQDQQDPADLCTMNGPPSSSDIFDTFFDCVCVTGCDAECGDNACMALAADQACQGCIFTSCGAEAQACLQDGGPAPCISCDDVLQGGDPADACTMNGPPSSSELVDAFTDCACVTGCAMECDQACMPNGMADNTCLACLGQTCQTELTECQNDGGPPPPVCDTCSEVLGDPNPQNLCDNNGPPSSQQIFDDLSQCVCVDSCANACANLCMGGQASNQCQNCIGMNCGGELGACQMDTP